MSLESLLQSAQSLNAAINFITNGNLMNILSAIGDVHLEAASRELANLSRSSNKRDCVNRAVGHLQAAHVSFEKQIPTSATQMSLDPWVYSTAFDKEGLSFMGLLLCHVYLREFRVAKKLIQERRQRRSGDDDISFFDTISGMTIGLLNPKTYIGIFTEDHQQSISVSDVAKFAEDIEKLIDAGR